MFCPALPFNMKYEDEDVLPPGIKLENFEYNDELLVAFCLQKLKVGLVVPPMQWGILGVMMNCVAASRKLTLTLSSFFLPQISRILYRRHGWGYLIIILINHHP